MIRNVPTSPRPSRLLPTTSPFIITTDIPAHDATRSHPQIHRRYELEKDRIEWGDSGTTDDKVAQDEVELPPLKKLFLESTQGASHGIQLSGTSKPLKPRVPPFSMSSLSGVSNFEQWRIYTRRFPTSARWNQDASNTISVQVKTRKRAKITEQNKAHTISPPHQVTKGMSGEERKSSSKNVKLARKKKFRIAKSKSEKLPKSTSASIPSLVLKKQFSGNGARNITPLSSKKIASARATKISSRQSTIEKKALAVNISQSCIDLLQISTPRAKSSVDNLRHGSIDLSNIPSSGRRSSLSRRGVPKLPQASLRESVDMDVKPLLHFDLSNMQINEVYPEHERKGPPSARSSINVLDSIESFDENIVQINIPNLNLDMLNISTKSISARGDEYSHRSSRSEPYSARSSVPNSARTNKMQLPSDIHYIPHTEIISKPIRSSSPPLRRYSDLTATVSNNLKSKASISTEAHQFLFFHFTLAENYWRYIFLYLPGIDLYNTSCTCKYFYNAIMHHDYFEARKQVMQREYHSFVQSIPNKKTDVPLSRLNEIQEKLEAIKKSDITEICRCILNDSISSSHLKLLKLVCHILFQHRIHKLEPHHVVTYLRTEGFISNLLDFDVKYMQQSTHQTIGKYLKCKAILMSTQLSSGHSTLSAPLSTPLTTSLSNPDNYTISQNINSHTSMSLQYSNASRKSSQSSQNPTPRSSQVTPRTSRNHGHTLQYINTFIDTLQLWLLVQYDLYHCEVCVSYEEKIRLINEWLRTCD